MKKNLLFHSKRQVKSMLMLLHPANRFDNPSSRSG